MQDPLSPKLALALQIRKSGNGEPSSKREMRKLAVSTAAQERIFAGGDSPCATQGRGGSVLIIRISNISRSAY